LAFPGKAKTPAGCRRYKSIEADVEQVAKYPVPGIRRGGLCPYDGTTRRTI
jgi:hypothetical protein